TAPNVDEYTDTAPNGAFEYRVAARFPAGAATFDSRTTRTVEVTFPNAPPVITTDLPARPFQELATNDGDSTWARVQTFTVTVTDPEGDPVDLQLLNPQPGMTFVPLRRHASPATTQARWTHLSVLGEFRPRLVFEANCGVRLEK